MTSVSAIFCQKMLHNSRTKYWNVTVAAYQESSVHETQVCVIRWWGKTGTPGAIKVELLGSQAKALTYAREMSSDKIKRGYETYDEMDVVSTPEVDARVFLDARIQKCYPEGHMIGKAHTQFANAIRNLYLAHSSAPRVAERVAVESPQIVVPVIERGATWGAWS